MNGIQIIIALVLIAWTVNNMIASVNIARRTNELDDIANKLIKNMHELEVMKTGMKARMEFLQMFVDEAERRRFEEAKHEPG